MVECPNSECREDILKCLGKKVDRQFLFKVIGGAIGVFLTTFIAGYTIYARGQDKKDTQIQDMKEAQQEIIIKTTISEQRLEALQKDINEEIQRAKEADQKQSEKLEKILDEVRKLNGH